MWGFTGEAMTALAAVCVCTCYTMAVIFSHMFTLFIQFHFLLILSLFCVWESIVDWMHACMRAQLLQLCPALYDPWTVAHQAPLTMGILQARILEWIATPSSRGSSRPRDWICTSWVSCITGGFSIPEPPEKPHSGLDGVPPKEIRLHHNPWDL